MSSTYEFYQWKSIDLPYGNYGYLLVDTISRAAALVDPAWDLGACTSRLEQAGADLRLILLTHTHPDHVGLVQPLLDRYAPTVFLSEVEATTYRFWCQNMRTVTHQERLQLGDTSITCLLTPGHTAGGLCYLLDEHILTGDTVFIEGVGICDTPGGSAAQMFHSVQMLKRVVPPHVRVYPGHSYGWEIGCTFGHLMENNLYFFYTEEAPFVAFRMRKNQKIPGLF